MLRIEHLSKSYGRKTALQDVSLEIREGITGLLGPNGSGKTTLLRCIAGILRPTDGKIIINGSLGYLPQRFGAFRELTLYEALEFFCSVREIPVKEQRKEILENLERVHLQEQAKDKVRSLSGGMLRRLGIAAALLGGPELLLVDEPTAGLDPEERLNFKSLMTELRKDRTVLISTHIVEDIEALADHIILLNEGKVHYSGNAEGLRSCAEGHVFIVPSEYKEELSEPFYMIREEHTGGRDVVRVLSEGPQDAEKADPTIEDGYILKIRGMG